MPRPFDNDLRRKFLAAYAVGKGTQAELCAVFGVSVSWAEKVCRQKRRSGQAERVEQRHGPLSRVDAVGKACLLKAIQERSDLTLAELQAMLVEQHGVRLCIAQVASRRCRCLYGATRYTHPFPQPPFWCMKEMFSTTRTGSRNRRMKWL